MTNYRRNLTAGGSFFFTVNLAERRLRLLTQHIDELRTAFRETRRHHPFAIDAMVVLPDHLHTIWTLPEGDADFAWTRVRIKNGAARPRSNSHQGAKSYLILASLNSTCLRATGSYFFLTSLSVMVREFFLAT